MSRWLKDRELLSGLLLLVIGATGFLTGLNYSFGSATRMGPGYFPSVLSGILFLIGAGIALKAMRTATAETEAKTPPIGVRPLLLILLSVVLFGALLREIGLVLTIALSVFVSRLAETRIRWIETAALAVVLAVGIIILFVYALGMPFPLWIP